jgi:acyl carrier protein phosphodiesterase
MSFYSCKKDVDGEPSITMTPNSPRRWVNILADWYDTWVLYFFHNNMATITSTCRGMCSRSPGFTHGSRSLQT